MKIKLIKTTKTNNLPNEIRTKKTKQKTKQKQSNLKVSQVSHYNNIYSKNIHIKYPFRISNQNKIKNPKKKCTFEFV